MHTLFPVACASSSSLTKYTIVKIVLLPLFMLLSLPYMLFLFSVDHRADIFEENVIVRVYACIDFYYGVSLYKVSDNNNHNYPVKHFIQLI